METSLQPQSLVSPEQTLVLPTSPTSKFSMFQGRIGVAQYWQSILLVLFLNFLAIIIILSIMVVLITVFLLKSVPSLAESAGLLVLLPFLAPIPIGIVSAVSLPFLLGIQIRRLHDINVTGWICAGILVINVVANWALAYLSPFIMYSGISKTGSFSLFLVIVVIVLNIIYFALSFVPGTKGVNKFGEQVRYTSIWRSIKGTTSHSVLWVLALLFLTPVIWLIVMTGLQYTQMLRPAKSPYVTQIQPGQNTQVVASAPVPAAVIITGPYAPPTLTPPPTWKPSKEYKYSAGYNLSYTSPDLIAVLGSQTHQGNMAILVREENPGETLDAISDENKDKQGFIKAPITVSNTKGMRADFDYQFEPNPNGPIFHETTLYFLKDGWAYEITAQTLKGSASETAAENALASVKLP